MQKSSFCLIGLAAFLISEAGTLAAAPRVQAPPLPPGSAKAMIGPGQNPSEAARNVRAHQRPKKDKQRDDTLPATATATSTAAPQSAVASNK